MLFRSECYHFENERLCGENRSAVIIIILLRSAFSGNETPLRKLGVVMFASASA